MSLLTRDQLLKIKEQFKSVHNIMPHRFAMDRTQEDLPQDDDPDGDIEAGEGKDYEFDSGNRADSKRPELKLALGDVRKGFFLKDQGDRMASSRSEIMAQIKKYNYTKNSLNCIPLTNKFRQWFIMFVEWKHQSNLVLFFVAINSIFLGIVDYRFKGSYQDPGAPLGNYLLGITEPIYAVLFTTEALVKIVAQGFILSKKTYLRDMWNVLDFVVVITALLSFSPDISSVSILRAFRLFKPLRNLQVFPSMRLLMRTLVASAERLRFLIIFYFFVIMIFSIIGVNLMQGVQTYRCRQTPTPVDGDWLPVDNDFHPCGWVHKCEVACGTLYFPDVVVNGTATHFDLYNVHNLKRDSSNKFELFGYANFDNIYQGCLTLFQISTLQDWYKILYLMQDAYNSYISGVFFVVYLLMSNYFMHILTVGILMQKFIELNDHRERQEIYQKILGMEQNGEPINIEDLKNKFREEQKKVKEQQKYKKQKSLKGNIGRLLQKIQNHEIKPLPNTRYHQFLFPRICWRLHQNLIYESTLTTLAVINALTLSFIKYPDDSVKKKGGISVLQDNIDYITVIVAIIFFMDQFIKLVAQGFKLYLQDYENALYSFTSIGSLIHIGANGGRASPITACTLFKIFKIMRRSNYSQAFNQLVDSVIFTLSVMMSYCAIMVLFVYIFSLLGMQFFAGKLYFNESGDYDKVHGKVPRQNFDTITWAITTVIQTIIGDDWSEVMFNCMLATGWYACLYFIMLIIVGYIILMNLFLAIMIGNFEEASLIMRDTKFLKAIQGANNDESEIGIGNKITTEAALLTQFDGEKAAAQQEEQLNAFAIFSQDQTPNKGDNPQIRVDNFSKQVDNNSLMPPQSPNKPVEGGLMVPGQNQVSPKSSPSFRPNEANYLSSPEMKPTERVLLDGASPSPSGKPSQNDKKAQEPEAMSFEDEEDTPEKENYRQGGIQAMRTVQLNILDRNKLAIQVGQKDELQKIVVARRKNPFVHHLKYSSCCIFNRKNKMRQFIFRTVIDPDYHFPDKAFDLVQIEDLDPMSRREMMSMGFRKNQYMIHRTSGFFTVQWEALDIKTHNPKYNQYLRNQKNTIRRNRDMFNYLHRIFNYIVSCIIFSNLVFLLLISPLNDPDSARTQLVKKFDIICTILFIVEVSMKIISVGFLNSSIPGQKAFLLKLWNIVDLSILIMSVVDIFKVYPRYEGLPNSFKVIRTIHLLKLFKKNDLLEIIIQTMYRAAKPIAITLMMTLVFIFIYGLIGVDLFRGKYYYCKQSTPFSTISVAAAVTKLDCLNLGGEWVLPDRNFNNIFTAMLTLFEMMSSEDWITPAYMGIDAVDVDYQPVENNNVVMLLYFLPFMIIGHIFIWRMFGGVMIENFNRARDKFYDYALMTSEQRNWVEMQRSLIEKRLRVRIDDNQWVVRDAIKKIIQSSQFDYIILGCIFANTTLQAISFYGNPPVLDQIQNTAGYIFAGVFNLECILKMTALGKYYFWESHNIFDFALILGTDVGILLSTAFPNFSIGPLATLLRAFRIGRILRLLKEKKSLKMLIDTIFYIFPILINIVGFMLLIILNYSVIGIQLFSKVMHQTEISNNANFESLGGALLLLFRCTTGEKWNLLMREYAFQGELNGKQCLQEQSYEDYLENGPMLCGSRLSFFFFLSFVILMQLMVVNLFIAIVLEGFAQFSIQNNSIVVSHDYEKLIDLWAFYDPTATGWIKPKHLAFLMYELPAPLGKEEDYKEILKKTLDHNTMIKQYSDKKAINMKTKFIYNDQKGLLLPHNTVLKLLIDLKLPVYNFEGNSVCHFKDVCLTVTKKALTRNIYQKKDLTEGRRNIELQFDRIPEEQQKRLDEGWRQKYKNLQRAQLIDDYDTGKLWAGLYILKMMRSVNNGFGRTQFKKKLAQNRLFKKLQRKHHIEKKKETNMAERLVAAMLRGSKKQQELDQKAKQQQEALQQSQIISQSDWDNASKNNIEIQDQMSQGGGNKLQVPGGGSTTHKHEESDWWGTGIPGGPQRRGRSPVLNQKNLKDHQRSTWWLPKDPRARVSQQPVQLQVDDWSKHVAVTGEMRDNGKVSTTNKKSTSFNIQRHHSNDGDATGTDAENNPAHRWQ